LKTLLLKSLLFGLGGTEVSLPLLSNLLPGLHRDVSPNIHGLTLSKGRVSTTLHGLRKRLLACKVCVATQFVDGDRRAPPRGEVANLSRVPVFPVAWK
jgi:hypothetical protein